MLYNRDFHSEPFIYNNSPIQIKGNNNSFVKRLEIDLWCRMKVL